MYWFKSIEPSLSRWDGVSLNTVSNLFVFLNSVCKDFDGNVCVSVQQSYGPLGFFLFNLCCIWYQDNTGFVKKNWKCFHLFYSSQWLEECQCGLVGSALPPSNPTLFLLGTFGLLFLSHWLLWLNLNY